LWRGLPGRRPRHAASFIDTRIVLQLPLFTLSSLFVFFLHFLTLHHKSSLRLGVAVWLTLQRGWSTVKKQGGR
jgi:hypothetical protein